VTKKIKKNAKNVFYIYAEVRSSGMMRVAVIRLNRIARYAAMQKKLAEW